MKILFLHNHTPSAQNKPPSFQIEGVDVHTVHSLEGGTQALQDDRYDSVIIAASLGDASGTFQTTYKATQSSACHLILGGSMDQEIPTDMLQNGIDGYIELPLNEATLRHLVETHQNADRDILQPRTELRQRDEEIATLVTISNIVTSNLEFTPLFAAIAQETSRALEADRTTIFLYNDKRKELNAAYAEGLGPDTITVSAFQGIAGQVAMTRELMNVSEANQNNHFNKTVDQETGYTTHSILCVPLISPFGDLIGVAECLNKRNGRFTREDERLLNMLAPLYAVAIENALLYRDLQEQVQQNEQITVKKIQTERMATVGRMANAVTRDIVDPMEEIVRQAGHLGQIDLPFEEREATCQAIEQIVDHLINLAQEWLDFSRGSLDLIKGHRSTHELMDQIHALLDNTTTDKNLSHKVLVFDDTALQAPDVYIEIDQDKLARALSRIILIVYRLTSIPLSIQIEAADDHITLTLKTFSDAGLDVFMPFLDQPFSDAILDHDMGLKIAVAARVISAHGGTFARQSDDLSIRLPVIYTGG